MENQGDQDHAAAQETAHAQTTSQPERNYRAILYKLGIIGVALTFGVLTYFVRSTSYFPIDLRITRALQAIKFPLFSEVMVLVSWAGYFPQSVIIVLIIVGLFYRSDYHWEAVMNVIAAVFVSAANAVAKVLIHRIRPTANLVNVVVALKSYSFPSGHVMFYTCYFGFVGFLIYILLKRTSLRTLILTFLSVLILLVGVSRVYLGEHWTSDVVGAYLLGILALAGAIWFYRWGKSRFFTHSPIAGCRDKS